MEDVLKNAISNDNPIIWNNWKHENSSEGLIVKSLIIYDKNLTDFNLSEIKFENLTIQKCRLYNCHFELSNFQNCFIFDSTINYCNFDHSVFNQTVINQVDFAGSTFLDTKFYKCDSLIRLNLYNASLIETSFEECIIKEWTIYGANIWNIKTKDTKQFDLYIEYYKQRKDKNFKNLLEVDDIQMGNIIHFLTSNVNYTKLVDASKPNSVLVLGKFGNNLPNLEKIKNELRTQYSPIIFNFETSEYLDYIELIILLALLSRFIIVDLTDAKSVPAELQAILSTLMIPVIPILQKDSALYGTYSSMGKYSWVSNVLIYGNIDQVISKFQKAIINPAEEMCKKVEKIRSRKVILRDIDEI